MAAEGAGARAAGVILERGDMRARLAEDARDLEVVLGLRRAVWGAMDAGEDAFDARATQLLVEARDGTPLAALRLFSMPSGAAIEQCYSSAFYDLSAFHAVSTPILEAGRFALSRGAGLASWEVLRLLWAALALLLRAGGAGHVIGCSSFLGADLARHYAGLSYLRDRHLQASPLMPKPRAPEVVWLRDLAPEALDPRAGQAALAPLLRFYLGLGAWVSDHAVIDRALDTVHVFTCLDLAHIAEPGRTALRAAGG